MPVPGCVGQGSSSSSSQTHSSLLPDPWLCFSLSTSTSGPSPVLLFQAQGTLTPLAPELLLLKGCPLLEARGEGTWVARSFQLTGGTQEPVLWCLDLMGEGKDAENGYSQHMLSSEHDFLIPSPLKLAPVQSSVPWHHPVPPLTQAESPVFQHLEQPLAHVYRR